MQDRQLRVASQPVDPRTHQSGSNPHRETQRTSSHLPSVSASPGFSTPSLDPRSIRRMQISRTPGEVPMSSAFGLEHQQSVGSGGKFTRPAHHSLTGGRPFATSSTEFGSPFHSEMPEATLPFNPLSASSRMPMGSVSLPGTLPLRRNPLARDGGTSLHATLPGSGGVSFAPFRTTSSSSLMPSPGLDQPAALSSGDTPLDSSPVPVVSARPSAPSRELPISSSSTTTTPVGSVPNPSVLAPSGSETVLSSSSPVPIVPIPSPTVATPNPLPATSGSPPSSGVVLPPVAEPAAGSPVAATVSSSQPADIKKLARDYFSNPSQIPADITPELLKNVLVEIISNNRPTKASHRAKYEALINHILTLPNADNLLGSFLSTIDLDKTRYAAIGNIILEKIKAQPVSTTRTNLLWACYDFLVTHDLTNRTAHFVELVALTTTPELTERLEHNLRGGMYRFELVALFNAVAAKTDLDPQQSLRARGIISQAMREDVFLTQPDPQHPELLPRLVRPISLADAKSLDAELRLILSDETEAAERAEMTLLSNILKQLQAAIPKKSSARGFAGRNVGQTRTAVTFIAQTLEAKFQKANVSQSNLKKMRKLKEAFSSLQLPDNAVITKDLTDLLINFHQLFLFDPDFQAVAQRLHPQTYPQLGTHAPEIRPNLFRLTLFLNAGASGQTLLDNPAQLLQVRAEVQRTLAYYQKKLAATSKAHHQVRSRIEHILENLKNFEIKMASLMGDKVTEEERPALRSFLATEQAAIQSQVGAVVLDASKVSAVPITNPLGVLEARRQMGATFSDAEVQTLARLTRLNPYKKKSRHFSDWWQVFFILPLFWLIPKYLGVGIFFRTKEAKFKHEVFDRPLIQGLIKQRQNPYMQSVLLQMVLTNLQAAHNEPRQVARALYLLRKTVFTRSNGYLLGICPQNRALLAQIWQLAKAKTTNEEVQEFFSYYNKKSVLATMAAQVDSFLAQAPAANPLLDLANGLHPALNQVLQMFTVRNSSTVAPQVSLLQGYMSVVSPFLQDLANAPHLLTEAKLTQGLDAVANTQLALEAILGPLTNLQGFVDALPADLKARYEQVVAQKRGLTGADSFTTIFTPAKALLASQPAGSRAVASTVAKVTDFSEILKTKAMVLATDQASFVKLQEVMNGIRSKFDPLTALQRDPRGLFVKEAEATRLGTELNAELAKLDAFKTELASKTVSPGATPDPARITALQTQVFAGFSAQIQANLEAGLFDYRLHEVFNPAVGPSPALSALLSNQAVSQEARNAALREIFTKINSQPGIRDRQRPWIDFFMQLQASAGLELPNPEGNSHLIQDVFAYYHEQAERSSRTAPTARSSVPTSRPASLDGGDMLPEL